MIGEKCPNCGAYFDDPDEYYEEPEISKGFWRAWHYYCHNCAKKYVYTRYYECTGESIDEET